MGQRRMLSKVVTDDDQFISMTGSGQALYLHLLMSADDDGFTNQVQVSMFKAHATSDDFDSLIKRNFIYQFEDGIVVIRHWKAQNNVKNDRYHPTRYKADVKNVKEDANGVYQLMDPDWIQLGSDTEPELNSTKPNLTKNKNIMSGNPDGVSSDKSQRSEKNSYSSEINDIINYLNQKTGKHFRNVDSTQKLIKELLKNGYSVDDFKTVISKKCDKWLNDPKWDQYLRPMTLFNPKKFESYLNEKDVNDHGNVSIRMPKYLKEPHEEHSARPDTIEEIKRMQRKMKQ